MNRRLISIVAGVALALGLTGTVLGHDVQTVSGTVDCQGAYTITVHADVWDPTHLIVTLNGATIYDQATGSSSQAQRDIVLTGTGASAGQAITARTGDESAANGASGSLVGPEGGCVQPTPTPTPRPTPTPTTSATPTPTPVVTPRPNVTPPPTSTPVVTPRPNVTPPPTSTVDDVQRAAQSDPRILFVGFAAFGVLLLVFSARPRSSRGQGLAEYALILALIAVVAIVGLTLLGADVRGFLTSVGKHL